MKVFLVRHGQSDAHALGTRQQPESPLSSLGRKEAEAIGKRVKRWGVSFDRIFTSKLSRAKETAEIVARELDSKVEEFEGIHEREQHPGLYGAKLESKINKENVLAYEKNSKNLDFKFQGKGESIRDVAKRASAFKKHLLKNHSGENLLVVSHGLFIKAFVTVCILGDNYHDDSFANLFSSFSINNTGVSLLRYSEESKHWKVVYINNFSHLSEITP